jgi:hypothetical protein
VYPSQLIQSLSVTGACLDMSRLVVANQKAHRQTDTGSKVYEALHITNVLLQSYKTTKITYIIKHN